jgi:hypothetical protein
MQHAVFHYEPGRVWVMGSRALGAEMHAALEASMQYAAASAEVLIRFCKMGLVLLAWCFASRVLQATCIIVQRSADLSVRSSGSMADARTQASGMRSAMCPHIKATQRGRALTSKHHAQVVPSCQSITDGSCPHVKASQTGLWLVLGWIRVCGVRQW